MTDLDTLDQMLYVLSEARNALAVLPKVEREREEWKQKYLDLLNQNIKHNDDMAAGFLKMALAGCIKAPDKNETAWPKCGEAE